jgi:uncharacterized protein (TIGR02285 family)
MGQAAILQRIIVAGILMIAGNQCAASTQDTINWYYPDFAPTNIVEGPFKGRDIVTKMYRNIFPTLSDYRHFITVANFHRTLEAMKAKEKVCAVAILKNKERSQYIAYSRQHFLVHPVRLIVLAHRLPDLLPYRQKDGTYNLADILGKGKLRLGYSLGRSYSKKLDDTLRQHVTDQNSVVSAQNPITAGLVKMLLRDRFDFTLGYAHEAAYFAKTLAQGKKIVSLPISGSTELNPVYIGCSANEWGRTIIKRLDKLIIKVRTDPAYYGGYLTWLDPETRKNYVQQVENYFSQKRGLNR